MSEATVKTITGAPTGKLAGVSIADMLSGKAPAPSTGERLKGAAASAKATADFFGHLKGHSWKLVNAYRTPERTAYGSGLSGYRHFVIECNGAACKGSAHRTNEGENTIRKHAGVKVPAWVTAMLDAQS